jgi:hypothetical protein
MTTNHAQIVKALEDLGAKEWSLSGDSIADIVWHTEDTKTEAEIKAAIDNPLPVKETSVEDKLASVGLSIEELKAALGGN